MVEVWDMVGIKRWLLADILVGIMVRVKERVIKACLSSARGSLKYVRHVQEGKSTEYLTSDGKSTEYLRSGEHGVLQRGVRTEYLEMKSE